MEDAALARDAPPDRRVRGTVNLREALGSDVVVHIEIDARLAITDDVRELAADIGGHEAMQRAEESAQRQHAELVGRLSPHTRAQKGEVLEVVVDTARLHFFDPDDGSGIYGRVD
jgi:multiple sugar transport system ATP-binding protein